MSTTTFTTVLDHSTDAAFRTWAAELITEFVTAGATQTSDTGQINTTTVTRASTNADAGYAIFRNGDSSIFWKLYFGTGSNAAYPRIRIEAATGSNGSGTLTGQGNGVITDCSTYGTVISSTTTPYPSYICVTNIAVSFLWKVNAPGSTYSYAWFNVCRTVDSAGAVSSIGFSVVARPVSTSGSPTSRTHRTAASAVSLASSTFFCLAAGNPTASALQNGDIQAYLWWHNAPEVLPNVGGCCFVKAEVAPLTTVSVALVGAVSHTYLVGSANDYGAANAGSSTHANAFIYE